MQIEPTQIDRWEGATLKRPLLADFSLRVRREAASSGQLMGLRKLGLFTPHISSDMVHLLQGFGSG